MNTSIRTPTRPHTAPHRTEGKIVAETHTTQINLHKDRTFQLLSIERKLCFAENALEVARIGTGMLIFLIARTVSNRLNSEGYHFASVSLTCKDNS